MRGLHFRRFRERALKLSRLDFANLPAEWDEDDYEEWVETQYRKLYPDKDLTVIPYKDRQ